jgi:shikimate kinase
MNLVLIGYRGTGKTAVGRILGQRLDLPKISLDEEVVRREARRIPEIVEADGWDYFRDRESELIKEFAKEDGQILDCGGGVVERPENIEVLRANGTVYWLTAPAEVIISRIQEDADRPSLVEGKSFTEEVEEVLARRQEQYAAAAHVTIDTSDLNPDEVADAIQEHWGSEA